MVSVLSVLQVILSLQYFVPLVNVHHFDLNYKKATKCEASKL